jgi:hypothetical protein
MLSALAAERADHIVVGGYAVGIHVEPRATKDIDIFVRPSAANARRVMKALERFGAPTFGVEQRDLATPGMVVQIGVPPRRIDIITSISGVSFDDAWRTHVDVTVKGLATPMAIIGRDALIKNKRATGRPQDLADVAGLEGLKPPRRPPRKR